MEFSVFSHLNLYVMQ